VSNTKILLGLVGALVVAVSPSARAQDVLTGGYDLARTNADPYETVLSPATVDPAQFGQLFQLPADGQIYAQPLYQRNVAIAGQGVHNVVFIATAHNSVYAYDADTAGTPLWTVNLGPSVPSTAYNAAEGAYTDISPEIGIIGTPVIDASTGTLYVVAATVENGAYYYRLHALNTASGAERFGAPVAIQARVRGSGVDSVNGVVSFNALQQIQRPALLLLNGVVYIAFGSHGDGPPWHGWIMGYSAANVQTQTAVFNTTPNGNGGSVWNSGRGLSVDSQGNIYTVTGNGDTDGVTAFSDSVLKLNAGNLSVSDWFAPSDVQALDDDDNDLGASGAMLVPGTNLMIAGGKQGIAYLLTTNSLGHMSAGDSQIPQSFQAVNPGIFNAALWNRSTGPVLYLQGGNGPVEAFPFTGNPISTTASSQSSSAYNAPYDGYTISSNGGAPGSGILWVTTGDTWPLPAPGTLHAFNADDLSAELWNSSINIGRDGLGEFAKFANPTVANGKVYVPTNSGALVVYGRLQSDEGGASTPVITGIVNAASYANGGVAPGEIVAIYGQNLGPRTLTTGSWDADGNLGVEIAGTQVTFNGTPAPLLYASAYVIAAIVPFEVAAANQTDIQVSYDGSPSLIRTLAVAAGAPGVFTLNFTGRDQAAALNQDTSLNSEANPAAPGSVLSVYATGGGQTDPPDTTGSTAQGMAQVTASISATIGGQPAPVQYAGHAPGEVAGVMQVNIQVPNGVTGWVPVTVTVAGTTSQSTAMVAIQ
jgi:uncharacterized protein (TIGR03437 family)